MCKIMSVKKMRKVMKKVMEKVMTEKKSVY